MSLRTQKINAIAAELAKEGKISAEQLDDALAASKAQNIEVSEYLIDQNLITEKDFNIRLAAKAGVSWVSLEELTPDPSSLKIISPEQATRWKIFPIHEKNGKLTVAVADPFDLAALDEAKNSLGRDLDSVLASKKEVQEAILKHYGQIKKSKPTASGAVEVISYDAQPGKGKVSAEAANTLATKVVASVDQLLHSALQERASDIHLEPTREGLKIRFRIDGVLEPFLILPPTMKEAILSRIKIMGGMDVAEHRITQDGRTRLRINDKEFDIRIATYPTMFGEAAAIRILTKDDIITLDTLGFLGKDREVFEKLIHRPHGIILVTGPTGSGKTTTLYAALQKIDRDKSHVLSIEDPIENEIEGVDQTQINAKAGVTFPTVLRAMMRQDPDVIMVGEIRDKETAEISLGAAMTGHLVLSTLHTNTAIGAIARLNDLGIESYLISSTLLGVIAQRLVRRICQHCKEPTLVPPELMRELGPKGASIQTFKGHGCSECEGRGFTGRIGIFELIEVDEEFRVLMNNKAPDIRLREKASAAGFHSILEDGIEKINAGFTTVEEVLRVCGRE
jgi:type IV pilus assembly protein PilB